MKQIKETKLKIIEVEKGNVFHALKSNESDFNGFGEAYFSSVIFKDIKAWKKHKNMTLNLIVIIGLIKFVLYDDRENSSKSPQISQFIIGPEQNYARLTVPPGVWFGFQGYDKGKNILLNIADIEHEPNEIERKPLEFIKYNWN